MTIYFANCFKLNLARGERRHLRSYSQSRLLLACFSLSGQRRRIKMKNEADTFSLSVHCTVFHFESGERRESFFTFPLEKMLLRPTRKIVAKKKITRLFPFIQHSHSVSFWFIISTLIEFLNFIKSNFLMKINHSNPYS